jgi:hypothetical protein
MKINLENRVLKCELFLEGCVFPKGVDHLVGRCSLPYSFDNEDEGYYEAGWVPMNKSKIQEIKNDKWFKSPWSYKSAWQLKGTPYWGYFSTYWGGGRVSFKTNYRKSSLAGTQNFKIVRGRSPRLFEKSACCHPSLYCQIL